MMNDNYKMNEKRESSYYFEFSNRKTGEILLSGNVTGGNKQDCKNAANEEARMAGYKPFADDLKLYMKAVGN